MSTVSRVGFPLDHPYVERCLLPLMGPSCFVLVRFACEQWRQQDPVRMLAPELAKSVGLGLFQLPKTLDRLVYLGFGKRPSDDVVLVFDRCAPLSQRLLDKMPPGVRHAHHDLLAAHIDDLAHRDESSAVLAGAAAQFDDLHRPAADVPELKR